MPVMSLDSFKNYIGCIAYHRQREDELSDWMSDLTSCDTYCNIFSDYENYLVELLDSYFGFEEESSPIDYFLYELNLGADYTPGCFTDNGKDISLATVEDLYNYIVSLNN